MQAVVGEAPEGSWTHGGLPKVFTKVVFKKALLPKEKIKGIVDFSDRLYALRKEADYQEKILEKSEKAKTDFPLYLSVVEDLLKTLKEMSDDFNES